MSRQAVVSPREIYYSGHIKKHTYKEIRNDYNPHTAAKNSKQNGLQFLNDGNDVDTYEAADITTAENPDVDIPEDGLHLLNDGNDVDTYETADITTTENPDVPEGEMIKQVHNRLFSAPETFSKKRSMGSVYPPCERFGCGKREIYAHKKAFPKRFFTSTIRQLQLKRAQKRDGPPSCGRYGCGKRK